MCYGHYPRGISTNQRCMRYIHVDQSGNSVRQPLIVITQRCIMTFCTTKCVTLQTKANINTVKGVLFHYKAKVWEQS